MQALLQNNRCLLQVECLEERLAVRVKQYLQDLGYRLVFTLRDDYIFIHKAFNDKFDAIQKIDFNAIAADLRELLDLRRYKRRSLLKKIILGIIRGNADNSEGIFDYENRGSVGEAFDAQCIS